MLNNVFNAWDVSFFFYKVFNSNTDYYKMNKYEYQLVLV